MLRIRIGQNCNRSMEKFVLHLTILSTLSNWGSFLMANAKTRREKKRRKRMHFTTLIWSVIMHEVSTHKRAHVTEIQISLWIVRVRLWECKQSLTGGKRRIKKWSVSGAVRLQDCPSAENGSWWGTSSGWQLLLVTRLIYSSNLARNIQPPLSFEKAEAVDISWSLLIACWRQLNPWSFEIYISITTFQSSRGNRIQHEKIMEFYYFVVGRPNASSYQKFHAVFRGNGYFAKLVFLKMCRSIKVWFIRLGEPSG